MQAKLINPRQFTMRYTLLVAATLASAALAAPIVEETSNETPAATNKGVKVKIDADGNVKVQKRDDIGVSTGVGANVSKRDASPDEGVDITVDADGNVKIGKRAPDEEVDINLGEGVAASGVRKRDAVASEGVNVKVGADGSVKIGKRAAGAAQEEDIGVDANVGANVG